MSLLAFLDTIWPGEVGDDENWKHFLMCARGSAESVKEPDLNAQIPNFLI